MRKKKPSKVQKKSALISVESQIILKNWSLYMEFWDLSNFFKAIMSSSFKRLRLLPSWGSIRFFRLLTLLSCSFLRLKVMIMKINIANSLMIAFSNFIRAIHMMSPLRSIKICFHLIRTRYYVILHYIR